MADDLTTRPGQPTTPGGAPPPQSYWGPPPDVVARPGPAPGYAYAGFWIRLLAYLIDLVPVLILTLLVLWPVLSSLIASFGELPPLPADAEVGSAEYEAWQRALEARMNEWIVETTPASGLAQLISVVYYVGFWAWRGQTPGMIALDLRIARESDGANPGLARSLLRYVGYIISSIPLGLGFLWIAWDSRKQGWHDKIAGTVVVRPAR